MPCVCVCCQNHSHTPHDPSPLIHHPKAFDPATPTAPPHTALPGRGVTATKHLSHPPAAYGGDPAGPEAEAIGPYPLGPGGSLLAAFISAPTAHLVLPPHARAESDYAAGGAALAQAKLAAAEEQPPQAQHGPAGVGGGAEGGEEEAAFVAAAREKLHRVEEASSRARLAAAAAAAAAAASDAALARADRASQLAARARARGKAPPTPGTEALRERLADGRSAVEASIRRLRAAEEAATSADADKRTKATEAKVATRTAREKEAVLKEVEARLDGLAKVRGAAGAAADHAARLGQDANEAAAEAEAAAALVGEAGAAVVAARDDIDGLARAFAAAVAGEELAGPLAERSVAEAGELEGAAADAEAAAHAMAEEWGAAMGSMQAAEDTRDALLLELAEVGGGSGGGCGAGVVGSAGMPRPAVLFGGRGARAATTTTTTTMPAAAPKVAFHRTAAPPTPFEEAVMAEE